MATKPEMSQEQKDLKIAEIEGKLANARYRQWGVNNMKATEQAHKTARLHYGVPAEPGETPTGEAIEGAVGAAQKQSMEDVYQADKALMATHSQLKSLMSQKAAQWEEAKESDWIQKTQEFTDKIPGISQWSDEDKFGGKGRTPLETGLATIGSKALLPGFARTDAYFGSQAQAAMRTTPLLTGSKRMIKSMTEMMFKSFPSQWTPGGYTEARVEQSFDDFFGFQNAVVRAAREFQWKVNDKGEIVVPDNVSREQMLQMKDWAQQYEMSEEQQKKKEWMINDIINAPAAQLMKRKEVEADEKGENILEEKLKNMSDEELARFGNDYGV